MKTKQSKPQPLPPSPRVEVLNEAIRVISKDRSATHGEPEDSFAFIAALWDAYLTHTGRLADGEALTRADAALMLALLKTARAGANPLHRDNWVDLGGYAGCGYEAAQVDAAGKNIVSVRDQDGREIKIT